MTKPEDVTSQSLLDTLSHNQWVKARGKLIREYAICETAISGACEVDALISSGLPDPEIISALRTWVQVTRETAVIPS